MQHRYSYLIVVALIIGCLSFGFPGRAQDLSAQGRGHFIAAQRLFEMVSSVDDYKMVAEEFEAVAKTDPSFAKTYINLCLVYSRIGAEQGEPYFSKAEAALETYKKLAPEDIDGYTEEAISLKAMRRKYEDGRIKNKTGNWYISEGNENVFCPSSIAISTVSPHEVVFNFPDNRITSRTVSQDMDLSKKENKLSFEYTQDYGQFKVGRGRRGGSEILVLHQDGSWGSYGEVTGYYDAYELSKLAVKESEIVEYSLSFENNQLVLYWSLKTNYMDGSGRRLFYQSSNPIRAVFNKR